MMMKIRNPLVLCLLILLFNLKGNANAAEFIFDIEAVTVEGLSANQLGKLAKLSQQQLNSILKVVIQLDADKPLSEDAVKLLGRSEVISKNLIFHPRFPFDPGQAYFVSLSLEGVGETLIQNQLFSFVEEVKNPSARVVQIYPSSTRLPENLFKFYIHFSQPMSRGQAYQRIQLLDQEGRRVELPFLELGEELWNPQGTRFTLLFDPGRIKQNLVPNLESGLPLVEGRQFTLLIQSDWTDANGIPLIAEHRKKITVVARDITQPDTQNWQMSSPSAGTREPLRVIFDEPLDHGLLQDTITVETLLGEIIAGKIEISHHETQWSFTPDLAWQSVELQLVVEGILEDRSANSLGRAFEVFVDGEQGPKIDAIYKLTVSIVSESTN